ncbi:hypothetical protein D9M68_453880 [compost metagenome]
MRRLRPAPRAACPCASPTARSRFPAVPPPRATSGNAESRAMPAVRMPPKPGLPPWPGGWAGSGCPTGGGCCRRSRWRRGPGCEAPGETVAPTGQACPANPPEPRPRRSRRQAASGPTRQVRVGTTMQPGCRQCPGQARPGLSGHFPSRRRHRPSGEPHWFQPARLATGQSTEACLRCRAVCQRIASAAR